MHRLRRSHQPRGFLRILAVSASVFIGAPGITACSDSPDTVTFTVLAVAANGTVTPSTATAAVSFTFENRQIADGASHRLPYTSTQHIHARNSVAILKAAVPAGAGYLIKCRIRSSYGAVFDSLPDRTATCQLPLSGN